jgi:hypothetical protein
MGRETYTSKAHPPTYPPYIHPLPHAKPPRTHRLAHPHAQTLLILDFELGDPALRTELRAGEMA